MMDTKKNYLAFDLGAESGRAILGKYDGSKLTLHEIHRFPNRPVVIFGRMHWNVLCLFEEIKKGLALAAREGNRELDGIGCDSWGVDFGLIGKDNTLLGYPYHYRDSRTDGMLEAAFRKVSEEEIFRHTGIQFMKINTLYQLLSMVISGSPLLQISECLLMIADLFHFFLTGEKVSEFTLATTSQAYDSREGDWARPLLEKLGIPANIMPEVVAPGTVVGNLLHEITQEANLKSPSPVIASACHDTASAVAAAPAKGDNWAYLSSGTWSLLGIETPGPIINNEVLRHNLTNEGGVAGTFRFLKNITGLWLLQQCKRNWEKEGKHLSYGELMQMAVEAKPFLSLIDPESLAMKYRITIEQLEKLSGRHIEQLHLIGGGVQNRLLCQFTANATGIPVVAGPGEATAVGNILMQVIARGDISSLADGREIVRRSFPIITYQPEDTSRWEELYHRFQTMTQGAFLLYQKR
jgi:rhamnulokinase